MFISIRIVFGGDLWRQLPGGRALSEALALREGRPIFAGAQARTDLGVAPPAVEVGTCECGSALLVFMPPGHHPMHRRDAAGAICRSVNGMKPDSEL